MLTTTQLNKKYGVPNITGEGYLVTINLPYPMRISWDLDESITKMRCHKLVAEKFEAIFEELLAHYGYDKIVELGIDLYGGCFNYRKQRNGSALSRHSWGVAIDLDPVRNGLKTPVAQAQFAKKEYNKMFEIFEKHGFINLGKAIGRDTMHFEIGS